MTRATKDETPSASPVTMEAVAKAAGVSRATVSRVLSGTVPVSEKVRRSVFGAVERLGYVPNVMAQSLAARTSDIIGLLLRDPRVPAYGLLHSELQHHVSRLGMNMVAAVPDFTEGEYHERAALDRLIGLRVAGLIISTGVLSSRLIEPLTPRLPVVVVGRPETHESVYAVSFDEDHNARLLADAVANYGHRKVAVIAPVQGAEAIRAQAMTERLREHRVAVTVLTTSFFNEDNESDTVIGLVKDQRITAAMFPSDRRLVRFLSEAQRAGVRVPDDVSATGCDGIQDGAELLGLTTVRLPVEQAARRAVAVMRAMLSQPSEVAIRHERLRGMLVPGATLAPFRD